MKLFLVVLFASVLLAECYRILPKQLGGNREKWAKLKRFNNDQKFQQLSKPQSLQSNVEIYAGAYYITNITIGTPPQQFLVIIDPTSSDLMVHDATNNDYYNNTFNSTASSTYKFIGNTTNSHGERELIGQDVVKLGGIGTQQITIPNTRFIQYTSLDLVGSGIDGFLGLAFEGLSNTGGAPPLLNAIHQGLLSQLIFTTYFIGETNITVYPPPSWFLPGGKITYGGLDPQNCGDVIAYQALSSATYFQFTLSGISIGKYSTTQSYQAVIDVENEIRAPVDLTDAIANAIGAVYTGTDEGEWKYYIDCNAVVPPLNLKIGSTTLSIDAKYLITGNFGYCVVNMMPTYSSGFGPSVILGQSLAQQYCTVFDLGNKRIGFAPMKNGPADETELSSNENPFEQGFEQFFTMFGNLIECFNQTAEGNETQLAIMMNATQKKLNLKEIKSIMGAAFGEMFGDIFKCFSQVFGGNSTNSLFNQNGTLGDLFANFENQTNLDMLQKLSDSENVPENKEEDFHLESGCSSNKCYAPIFETWCSICLDKSKNCEMRECQAGYKCCVCCSKGVETRFKIEIDE